MKDLPEDLPPMDDADDLPPSGLRDDGEPPRPPSRISPSTLEAARAVDRHYAERRAERCESGGSHDD